MQTINGFLKTNGVTAIWCDKNGQTAETLGHIFKNQEISLFYNMLIINAISGDT